MLKKRWVLPENKCFDKSNETTVRVSPLIKSLLLARGYTTTSEQEAFLHPRFSEMLDPMLLKGMQSAVERIFRARQTEEKITVYGDYDVDGITSTALLVSFLRRVGCKADYFIPNRFDDGYGLNADSLLTCIKSGARLIISVDCGITSRDEALFCKEHGADLIVVDHHTPNGSIPDCCSVLNPLQPGCQYPFKGLAGVGVTFNLVVALRSALRNQGDFDTRQEPDLREWLDLLALGTIADVVPLLGQNRIYVHYGLQQISVAKRPGIAALMQVAGVKGLIRSGQVGFRLAPRLNAAGRMESAVPGVDLLLNDDSQQCLQIADELDAANSERQQIELKMLAQAINMVDSSGMYPACRSIVLASDEWHQGVMGIVASRIVERYNRPTILIALDSEGNGKGSGRSISGFNLLEALKPCSPFLKRFGGHSFAAGITIDSDQLESFKNVFETEARLSLSEDACIPVVTVDAEVLPVDVTMELAESLKMMEPFGAGNPEPTFMMRAITVLERRVMAEKHLRLRLKKNDSVFNAIAFGMAGYEADGEIDIAFFPEINQWNNASSLQLRIKDIRPAECI